MSFGADLNIDASRSSDVSESDYYKKLQKQLREKKDAKAAEAKHNASVQHSHAQPREEDAAKAGAQSLNIKDEVTLSTLDWDEALETEEGEEDLKEKQEFIKQLKMDGKKLSRYLGVKIDFEKRMPQLKEMFVHNIVQSKSNNTFMARFAKFKVGVVGQILAFIGVPIEELKKLKQKAIQEAFDENLEMMAENIYNMELTDMFYGKTKKNKRLREMHDQMHAGLVEKMNNIGRYGYWSKIRLIEEKIKQCTRIKEEFEKEKAELQYQVEYREQVLQ